MRDHSPTLRGQLLRRLMLPLAAVWLLSAALAFYFAERFSNLAYDRSLFDSTRSLAALIRVVDHGITIDLPSQAKQILRYDDYDRIYYQIKLPDGKVIAGDDLFPSPPADPKVSPNRPIYYDARIEGRKVRVASLYWPTDEGAHQPKVLVQFAETLVKRHILMEEIVAGIAMPQLLIIALAAFAVWLGIWNGLSSLNRLRDAISNRSHRDLSPISEKHIPLEIRPIIHSINELMERLSQAMAAQQRFIADASHQLRTPLAGLQAQAELALRQSSPEDIRHSLRQICISAERSAHLAKQLLTLARTEPGVVLGEGFEPLDLVALAREVTGQWVVQALERGIDLGFEPSDGHLMIKGHRVMLAELLRNLIENAVKYSRVGGRITVSVTKGLQPGLIVEDNGIGIPAEDRERVFDRFYRVLGSDVDGSGLGLSIAREITLRHGGEIWAEEPNGGNGTRVVVRFPESGG